MNIYVSVLSLYITDLILDKMSITFSSQICLGEGIKKFQVKRLFKLRCKSFLTLSCRVYSHQMCDLSLTEVQVMWLESTPLLYCDEQWGCYWHVLNFSNKSEIHEKNSSVYTNGREERRYLYGTSSHLVYRAHRLTVFIVLCCWWDIILLRIDGIFCNYI